MTFFPLLVADKVVLKRREAFLMQGWVKPTLFIKKNTLCFYINGNRSWNHPPSSLPHRSENKDKYH